MCQPLVADWERIESLAAMDASMLRCCSELETQGYTEEVRVCAVCMFVLYACLCCMHICAVSMFVLYACVCCMHVC